MTHHIIYLFIPQMYSQAPVLARALETNPDAVCHTNPLRVKSPTLKTELKWKKRALQTCTKTLHIQWYSLELIILFCAQKQKVVLTKKEKKISVVTVWGLTLFSSWVLTSFRTLLVLGLAMMTHTETQLQRIFLSTTIRANDQKY